MGRQDGVLQLTGKIGSLTFYKSKRGHEVRARGGVNGDRIRTDPAFERTRENGAEFGRATKTNRLIRAAFRTQLLKNADSLMISRLTREMMKVVKADQINARGERTVLGSNIGILQGFEFNEFAKLGSSLFAPFSTNIDRATGVLTLVLEEFIPRDKVVPPAGATHAQLVIAGAEIDFNTMDFQNGSDQTTLFALDGQPHPQITLSVALPPNSLKPIFLAVGIAFHQGVNGSYYPLKNGAYNALSLVKIEGGA